MNYQKSPPDLRKQLFSKKILFCSNTIRVYFIFLLLVTATGYIKHTYLQHTSGIVGSRPKKKSVCTPTGNSWRTIYCSGSLFMQNINGHYMNRQEQHTHKWAVCCLQSPKRLILYYFFISSVLKAKQFVIHFKGANLTCP